MDPPFFIKPACAFYYRGEVASRFNRRALLSLLDNPASNAARTTFFTILKNYLGYLYFGKTTEQLSGGFHAGRSVHTHVERRVVPETESPRNGIQLQRRNTQVGENAPRLFYLRHRQDPRYIAAVGMHGAKAR